MEQVIVTVQAERCWRCPAVIHPSEPLRQRQMITAVETGGWSSPKLRHEPVRLCQACDEELRAADQNEVARKRRFNGWVLGGTIAWLGAIFVHTQAPWFPPWALIGSVVVLLIGVGRRWPLVPQAREAVRLDKKKKDE